MPLSTRRSSTRGLPWLLGKNTRSRSNCSSVSQNRSIREGFDQLRARAAAGCVVLGDPAYHRRFGFEHDGGLRYEDAPPEYFMRISLNGDDPPKGCVDYASAFSG
jgi:hypothetical protein